MDKADTYGRISVNISDLGLKTICTVMVNLFGQMGANMKVTLSMTSNMVREPSNGRMVKYIQASGSMASSTEQAYSPLKETEHQAWASGRTANTSES